MVIIGCDFHPVFQQIAVMDTETGEVTEHKLMHADGEAERFYRKLSCPCLIGVEAVGNSQWFLDLAEKLGHEVWIGDPAQIRASYFRKQKTDRRDAGHILKLMLEARFPRVWVPGAELRDLRQLVLHRHRVVEMKVRVKTELQHLALNNNLQQKRKLWNKQGRTELMKLELGTWGSQRRSDLLGLHDLLHKQLLLLDRAVEDASEAYPPARLLMTQPGVGANTALAYALTIGDTKRFPRGKQVASYLGLVPRERSSGGKQRFGSISKQGNPLLRTLLVECTTIASRLDPGFRKEYQRRCHKKHSAVAKVAMARKLAVRLYWMLRTQTPYPQILHIGGSPPHSLVSAS